MAGMERRLPRRPPALCPRRPGIAADAPAPPRRQSRPVSAAPFALGLDRLRHLPRWLSPGGPGFVRDQHNLQNGEADRDGSTMNLSANHGVEGVTSDPAVAALRRRRAANFLTLLLLSRGTPMLLAGDERGRTQGGNNNAWCQDNGISSIDWNRSNEARERLVRRLLALRREALGLPVRRVVGGGTLPRCRRNCGLRCWSGPNLDPNLPRRPDPSSSPQSRYEGGPIPVAAGDRRRLLESGLR